VSLLIFFRTGKRKGDAIAALRRSRLETV